MGVYKMLYAQNAIFLLHEFKTPLQLMDIVIIIIAIAKEDRRWKRCHQTSTTWWYWMVFMSF